MLWSRESSNVNYKDLLFSPRLEIWRNERLEMQQWGSCRWVLGYLSTGGQCGLFWKDGQAIAIMQKPIRVKIELKEIFSNIRFRAICPFFLFIFYKAKIMFSVLTWELDTLYFTFQRVSEQNCSRKSNWIKLVELQKLERTIAAKREKN